MLTGKSRTHLKVLPNAISAHHALQPKVITAFFGLQQAAKLAGFNLQPASTFRDFSRQQLIWNNKFTGLRKVHNDNGQAIDITHLPDWQKCQRILRWSAVPGASRHHWGTEIDIFDPDLLPKNQALQLEPWEYQGDGYFSELADWLQEFAVQFDFDLPFLKLSHKKIGCEPWHLSYLPLAEQYQQRFNAEILQKAWEQEHIAGKASLLIHLNDIFDDYIL